MADNPSGQEANTANATNGEEIWDEQRLEDALKTLNDMYIQVSLIDFTVKIFF